MKSWAKGEHPECFSEAQKAAEFIFPELKESEDERMKGAIIATIHLYYGEPLEDEAKEMISWIEKQGEKLTPKLEESENEKIRKAIMACCSDHGHKYKWTGITTQDMLYWLGKQGNCKGQVNLPCFTFDDILALQCCMETVSKVQEDKVLYEKLKGLHSRVYDAYQLEKARRE